MSKKIISIAPFLLVILTLILAILGIGNYYINNLIDSPAYSITLNNSKNPIYSVYGRDLSGILIVLSFFFTSIGFALTSMSKQSEIVESKIENIEKRLERFYKPTEYILESDTNIENDYKNIIEELKKMKQFDHLTCNTKTKELFRYCTNPTIIDPQEIINKQKELIKRIQNEINWYETELNDLNEQFQASSKELFQDMVKEKLNNLHLKKTKSLWIISPFILYLFIIKLQIWLYIFIAYPMFAFVFIILTLDD